MNLVFSLIFLAGCILLGSISVFLWGDGRRKLSVAFALLVLMYVFAACINLFSGRL